MKKLLILLILPLSAHAEFSYDYVQLGIASVDSIVDGRDVTLGGLKSLNDNIYVGASYSRTGYDFDITSTSIVYGIGAHHELSEKTDIYGEIGNINNEVNFGFITVTDDAKTYRVGIRHEVEGLELIVHTSTARFSDDTVSSTGIKAIKPLKNYDLGAQYATAEDANLVGLFIRSNF